MYCLIQFKVLMTLLERFWVSSLCRLRKLGWERLSNFTSYTAENGVLQNWRQDFNPEMSASGVKAINLITSAGIQNNQKELSGTSLGVQCLQLHLQMPRIQVWSLVRQLKFHMLCGQRQNIKNARRDTVTNSVKTWKITKIAFWVGWKFIDLKAIIYIGEKNRNNNTSSLVIGKWIFHILISAVIRVSLGLCFQSSPKKVDWRTDNSFIFTAANHGLKWEQIESETH